jgi:tol-pal system protein YbgF
MKKILAASAAIIFTVSASFADDKTYLHEVEIQKMTNKLELLEHEVRLLKQQLASSVNTGVSTNNISVSDKPSGKPLVVHETPHHVDEVKNSEVAKSGSSEKQIYDLALATLKDKKYEAAKEQFADFITTYPKSSLLDRAVFWYSESYFAQKDFQNAALNYLKCYQKFPKGQKAGDALLKLSMSLSELKRKAEVCKIIKKLEQEFPNRSANAKKIANDLKLKHSCK